MKIVETYKHHLSINPISNLHMKNIKKLLTIILPGIIYFSCSKDPDTGMNPQITAIRPTRGSFSMLDTITGKGFESMTTTDSVSFNGHKAEIVSISNSQLIVKVPKLAGTGVVSISVNGQQVNGPVFTYDTTYAVQTYASGIVSPYGICVDTSNGNLFAADYSNNTVVKITPDGRVTHFADGINLPGGITIDGGGNLFVTNYGNNTISKITQAGIVSTYVENISHPAGITIDPGGNLYVTNFGDGNVSTISSTGSIQTVPTGITYTTGIARDVNGNLYITNTAANAVSKLVPPGTVSTFASNVLQPSYITIDNSGNLYTTDPVNNTITRITPAGNVNVIVSGLSEPDPIVADNKGNLFVGLMSTGSIAKISPQ